MNRLVRSGLLQKVLLFLIPGSTAVFAQLEFTGNTDFGLIAVGESSTRVFTLTNITTDSDVGITAIESNSSWFSIQDASAGIIHPGDSREIVVTFTPQGPTTSVYAGYIYIRGNGIPQSVRDVYVKGQVMTASLVFEGEKNFGIVEGGTTVSQQLTLWNNGTGPLIVTDIDIIPYSGGNAADYYSLDWNEGQIAAGERRLVMVTYSPEVVPSLPWAHRVTLVVRTNSTHEGWLDTDITGEVLVRSINWSGSYLNFGEIKVDETGIQSLTVRNEGNSPLTVTDIDIEDTDHFSIEWSGEAIIEPGENIAVTTQFIPIRWRPQAGIIQSELRILSNANYGKIGDNGSISIWGYPVGSASVPDILKSGTMYLGEGWYHSEMLGDFHPDADDKSRIYSRSFGWLHVKGEGEVGGGGFWFWSHQMKSWIWGLDLSESLNELLKGKGYFFRQSDKAWMRVEGNRRVSIGVRG